MHARVAAQHRRQAECHSEMAKSITAEATRPRDILNILDPVPYSVYDIIYYQNVGVPRTGDLRIDSHEL